MRRIFLIVSCCLLLGDIYAQIRSEKLDFQSYVVPLAEDYGIVCKMPERFQDLKIAKRFFLRQDTSLSYRCCPVLESMDENCLLLYPDELYYNYKRKLSEEEMETHLTAWNPLFGQDIVGARGRMSFELKTALGLIDRYGKNLESSTLDLDQYITTVRTGKKALKRFNADTVFIYRIPLTKEMGGKYAYCTGINFYKKNHPVLCLKLLLTEEGKKKESKYIDMLDRKVWYGELPYLSLSREITDLEKDYFNLSKADRRIFGLALGRMNVTESNGEYVTGLTSGKQIHISENLFAVFKKLLEDTNKREKVKSKR